MSDDNKNSVNPPSIPKDQILVDPVEIGKALAGVVESRSQLTLRIEDRLTPYVSLLVKVDSENQILYIDELLPKNGNEALSNGEIFSIRALCRGIPVFFGGNQILSVDGESGLLTYKLRFPDRLVYQQRRQFFRVSVGITQNCEAVIIRSERKQDSDAISTRGRVIDLSQRGARLQIPGQLSPELEVGEQLAECEISLPDCDYLKSQAEIRHFFYDEERDVSYCGLLFHGLGKVEQRKLDRYVLQLQREARKNAEN
jgi:c-di-GMP-binding flagellar brake protein YcgR